MKNIIIPSIFILSAALIADSAMAVPGGSYQDSCSNASFDGHTLTATCPTERGTSVTTSLQFADRCNGDIANINGVLVCR